jgi:hypothetical protein
VARALSAQPQKPDLNRFIRGTLSLEPWGEADQGASFVFLAAQSRPRQSTGTRFACRLRFRRNILGEAALANVRQVSIVCNLISSPEDANRPRASYLRKGFSQRKLQIDAPVCATIREADSKVSSRWRDRMPSGVLRNVRHDRIPGARADAKELTAWIH